MTIEDQVYIADFVRTQDRDRFLTALFAPKPIRSDLLALYAFNAEIARIRTTVSERLIGRMRLQWWRDVIASIYDGGSVPGGQPVVAGLAACISRHGLTRRHFDALLEARELDMLDDDAGTLIRDAADLERYAHDTSARLQVLALEVLETRNEGDVSAATHVGVAWALTGLARAVLFHAAEQRLFLPADRVAAAAVPPHSLAAPEHRSALAAMIADISAAACRHLDRARGQRVTRAAIPALLLGTAADDYLLVLARANHDPSDARVIRARPSIVRLTWNALRGTF